MKNKLLLVFPNYYQYSEWHWMPTNYLFLASTLMAAGFECVLVDDRFDRQESLALLDSHLDDALAVLITTATGRMLYNARELARYVKSKRDVPVIVGGPHASAVPEITIRDEPCFDYLLTGQAQHTVVELCRHIQQGIGSLAEIRNLYYLDDGKLIRTQPLSKVLRIDGMPELPYFDAGFIEVADYLNPDTVAINYTTTQGCVGKCAFCYYQEDYRFSAFDLDRVMRDLGRFKSRYGIRNINFEDPTLFVNPRRTRDLCNRMIADRIECAWRGNARVDTLRKFSVDDMRLAREAGCDVVHIGLESGSQRILKLMNKDIDVSDMSYLLRLSADSGVTFRFHLIIGVPTETLDDLAETARLLEQLQSTFPEFDYTINVFTPYPGNQLTELAKHNGYVSPPSLDEYETLELYSYDLSDPDDRKVIKEINIWESDVKVPWFDPSYCAEYFAEFRRLIPEKRYFKTTGGQLISAYAD